MFRTAGARVKRMTKNICNSVSGAKRSRLHEVTTVQNVTAVFLKWITIVRGKIIDYDI